MKDKREKEAVDKLYLRTEKILDDFRRLTGREDLVDAVIQRLAESHARQVALTREWAVSSAQG